MRKRFIRDSTGEGYADVAIALLIILAFTVSLFMLFPLFTARQSLDQTVKYVARTVEQYGKADSATLNAVLDDADILRPDDVQVDTTWFNAANKTIQLKTAFIVRVNKVVPITILRPVLGNPIVLHVRISSTARGISEVYWK